MLKTFHTLKHSFLRSDTVCQFSGFLEHGISNLEQFLAVRSGDWILNVKFSCVQKVHQNNFFWNWRHIFQNPRNFREFFLVLEECINFFHYFTRLNSEDVGTLSNFSKAKIHNDTVENPLEIISSFEDIFESRDFLHVIYLKKFRFNFEVVFIVNIFSQFSFRFPFVLFMV